MDYVFMFVVIAVVVVVVNVGNSCRRSDEANTIISWIIKFFLWRRCWWCFCRHDRHVVVIVVNIDWTNFISSSASPGNSWLVHSSSLSFVHPSFHPPIHLHFILPSAAFFTLSSWPVVTSQMLWSIVKCSKNRVCERDLNLGRRPLLSILSNVATNFVRSPQFCRLLTPINLLL